MARAATAISPHSHSAGSTRIARLVRNRRGVAPLALAAITSPEIRKKISTPIEPMFSMPLRKGKASASPLARAVASAQPKAPKWSATTRPAAKKRSRSRPR